MALLSLCIIGHHCSRLLSPPLLTRLDLIDARGGEAARHTVNPVNLPRWTHIPIPARAPVTARINPYWCSWLSDEARARVQNRHCFRPVPDPTQPQWCYLLGGQHSASWLTQTIYGAQVSLAVGSSARR